ncbi:MAG TPA: oligosaccharide flippase family protein [Microbacterium sp.]|nr:oligosaccharide flippase family protein [Microbacterium sp.]
MVHLIAWRFIGTLSAALVQFATYVLLARALGVGDYGVFAALFGVGSFITTLTGAGFTHRALRLRAEGDDPSVKRATMVAFRAALGTLLAVVVFLIGTSAELPVASCIVAASFILIDAVTDICQAVMAGADQLGRATMILIAQRLLLLTTAAAFVSTEQPSWLIGAALIATAANVAVTIRGWPRGSTLIKLITTSFSYWRANLASSLSQLETPVIALIGGSAASGLYGAGSRAGGPVNLLAQALLQAATPTLSTALPHERMSLFTQMRHVTWGIVGAALILAVPAGFAGAWLLGDEYTQAWPFIAGFVVSGALMGVNQAHQAVLFAFDRAASAARAVAIGAVAALLYAAVAAWALPIWTLILTPVVAQSVMQLGLARAVATGREDGRFSG